MTGGRTKREKYGGRTKGTLNKKTQEALLVQAQEHQAALKGGKKLAKDVLEEFMMLTAGMAAVYQPLPPGTIDADPNRAPDWDKFWQCTGMVRDFASALAKYQSPTFKAIAVYAPPDQTKPAMPVLPAGGNVVTIDDPTALQRVYRNRIAKVA
jgi:hypothetical protein